MSEREPFIVKPITPDGLLGWDKFGQFMVGWIEYPDQPERVSYTSCWDYTGQKCALCGHEFKVSAEEFRKIRRIDDFGPVHGFCLQRFDTLREKYDFDNILQKVGVRYDGLQAMPNQYSGGKWGPDWFKTTLYGRKSSITIGRRKRVWELELHDAAVTPEEYNGSILATTDKTMTKSYCPERVSIHAWTLEEAEQYIKCFWQWAQKEEFVDPRKEES